MASSQIDEDYLLALSLESQYAMEDANEEMSNLIPPQFRKGSPSKSPLPSTSSKGGGGASRIQSPRPSTSRGLEANDSPRSKARAAGLSIIAPEWEDLDPTPDLQAMFLQFNDRFFWGKLAACEVRWSPRMTLCAGLCSYSPRQRYCSIRLSVPLLKLRPRKDFVETLLHEMIHAYLFVTDGNDDHDGHGPAFHSHMHRINKETGTNISVYHSFHDEVALYKQHWWKCNGPCVSRKPFYGLVKRSMNRAPGPNDTWWREHQASCGGAFTKIKEPEGYSQKKKGGKKAAAATGVDNGLPALAKGQKDIRSFGGKGHVLGKGQGGSGKKASPTKGHVLGKVQAVAGASGRGDSPLKGRTVGAGKISPIKGGRAVGDGGGGAAKVSPIKGSNGRVVGGGGAAKVSPINGFANGKVGGGGGGRPSPVKGGGGRGNIFGFGGTSFESSSGGGLQTKGKSGSFVVNPGWKAKDNSSTGQVIKKPGAGASGGGGRATSTVTSSSSSGGLHSSWSATSSSVAAANLNDSSEKVRAATRDFWSNKFAGGSSSSNSAAAAAEELKDDGTRSTGVDLTVDNEGKMTNCPVCDKRVAASKINSHLDECLTMATLSQEDPNSKRESSSSPCWSASKGKSANSSPSKKANFGSSKASTQDNIAQESKVTGKTSNKSSSSIVSKGSKLSESLKRKSLNNSDNSEKGKKKQLPKKRPNPFSDDDNDDFVSI